MQRIFITIFILIITVCGARAANLTYENFCIDNKIRAGEEAAITKIIETIYNGTPSQAIILCNGKISSNANRPTYYLFRGFANMKQNNFKVAITDLTTAINKDSNFSIMSYYLRAICYFSQNDYTKGFNDMDKALSMLNYIPKTNKNMPPKEERYVWHYKTSDNYHVVSYIINRAYIYYAKKYILNEINKAQSNSTYTPNYNALHNMYEKMIKASETMSIDNSEIYNIELTKNMDRPIYISDVGSALNSLSPQKESFNSNDGIDWDSYMETVQNKIKQVWSPDDTQHRRAIVRFSISRDGSVSNIRVTTSSGSEYGDRNCINAIKQAAPFRPLPSNYTDNRIDIDFTFTPNL